MAAPKWILLTGFALLALAQIAAPLLQIAKYEAVIAWGTEYKFKTAPVDPPDVLRGRYVRLSFDAEREADKLESGRSYGRDYGSRFWISISSGEDGFAKVSGVSRSKPSSGDAFSVVYDYRFQFPFNQYFMNEWKAQGAEDAYRRSNVRRNSGDAPSDRPPTYATVKIWRGAAVLTNLYIEGKPVSELAPDAKGQ